MRNHSLWKITGASRRMLVHLIFLLSLMACTDGKAPFLTAQVWLHDKAGLVQLVDELKAVAKEKNMMFIDNTATTLRDLAVIGEAGSVPSDGTPLLNVRVGRKDGMSVGVTNLGLPGYQFMLGFLEGGDRAETERFTNDVIAKLEKNWVVERLPAGVGVLPKRELRKN